MYIKQEPHRTTPVKTLHLGLTVMRDIGLKNINKVNNKPNIFFISPENYNIRNREITKLSPTVKSSINVGIGTGGGYKARE